MTHPRCKTRYSLDGLCTPFCYLGGIRKGIKLIKFKRVKDIIPMMAKLVLMQKESLAFQKFIDTKPTLVPVPLYSSRKRSRWFNQSEELAIEIGSRLHLPVESNLLLRIKKTKPQSELHKSERLGNIKGAFQINSSSNFKLPTSVIVIDDVWTTGATMREAGNVLKRAGVKRVWCLTVAR
jgi:ComF family protein